MEERCLVLGGLPIAQKDNILTCCLRLSWEDLLHGIQTLAAQLYQQIPWTF